MQGAEARFASQNMRFVSVAVIESAKKGPPSRRHDRAALAAK